MTKKYFKLYVTAMMLMWITAAVTIPAFAADDMWTAANRIIVDVYGKIAGISTVLAGLMSAVAVVGAKLSNNQHKVDQAWDWLKRIWIAGPSSMASALSLPMLRRCSTALRP